MNLPIAFSTKNPNHEIKAVLSKHLPWHGAQTPFLAHFLPALIKVRSVNLAELARRFGGKAKVDSHYKRLQRPFRSFDIDYLVRLVQSNTADRIALMEPFLLCLRPGCSRYYQPGLLRDTPDEETAEWKTARMVRREGRL